LFGEHNIQNTLPAIMLAKELGMTYDEIKNGLENLKISSMRFELIDLNEKGLVVNDAYNASPVSMKASIKTFMDTFMSSKIIVLGDMYELGEDESKMHEDVGEYLNQYEKEIELLITVGEKSQHISDVYKGKKMHFTEKQDASLSINELKNRENVMLFKASRGMKLEELIKTIG